MAIINRLETCTLRLLQEADEEEIVAPANQYTSLSIAASRGLFHVVEALLLRGADPNYLDGEERDITALQMACISDLRQPPTIDHPGTVDLLAQKTKVSVLKSSDTSPFDVALDHSSFDCMALLCRHYRLEDFPIQMDCRALDAFKKSSH